MLEKVKQLIEQPLKDHGFELVGLSYENEAGANFLRVIVDLENQHIDMIGIVEATDIINEYIDEQFSIKYDIDNLEVMSPGAEKPLESKEKLKTAVGQYVHIDFVNPTQGMDAVEGELLSFEDEQLSIQYKVKNIKKTITIDYDNVKTARLAVKF